VKTSPNGLQFIARHEGCVLHTYKDSAGKDTIGYGHLLRPGESFPDGITQGLAMAMLASDVAWAESGVNSIITSPMTQNQFDALVSFTFNCGTGALKASSIRSQFNAGNVQQAADAIIFWDHRTDPATGKLVVDNSLLKRRQEERALFLTPDPEAQQNAG